MVGLPMGLLDIVIEMQRLDGDDQDRAERELVAGLAGGEEPEEIWSRICSKLGLPVEEPEEEWKAGWAGDHPVYSKPEPCLQGVRFAPRWSALRGEWVCVVTFSDGRVPLEVPGTGPGHAVLRAEQMVRAAAERGGGQ